jgi:hypothetical protein
MFSYGGIAFTLLTELPANLTPTNTAGTATVWSVSPALPGGLTFDTANGTIAGTPTATAAATSYTVTASNSAGMHAVTLVLTVESGVLMDVGNAGGIAEVHLTSTRALALDGISHWVLWDYASAANLANGNASCRLPNCGVDHQLQQPPIYWPHIDLAGGTVVIETSTALEVRSAVDGSVLGEIPAPAPALSVWPPDAGSALAW